MIGQQFSMIANEIGMIEIGKTQCPAKVGKTGKINYIMDKFRELNSEEMQEIVGGVWPIIWAGTKWITITLASTAAVELITEGWTSVKNDFNTGFNEVRYEGAK
ncbi:MAG: class IIb bacteriocin, lactobin A/cerein 7B family [Lunatimonas sp.]|uniref:class IIb bacteriocin, lactobin A/cerein 7B family n=1 Tax=Lunatimonas sp. TaxID=2060141 RepID=UPI00263AB190|nr:class IIb bacteriocin, lactobin A/cerein 7B family [Lunatimonas sp.]MCC5936683.1 class IIb bacteriocin, lactobin A/cerein 7B family [Lunatimonas sp.]